MPLFTYNNMTTRLNKWNFNLIAFFSFSTTKRIYAQFQFVPSVQV